MANAPRKTSWLEKASTFTLHILPQHLLARAMYWLARVEWKPLKSALIRFLVYRYKIDVSEAADPNLDHYPHFNAFFTRALRPDSRPIAGGEHSIVSPVDGQISQMGRIKADRLIQAKDHDFSLRALLAGDIELASQFRDGSFATLYLSPRDYHRVHMPVNGRLNRMLFVPGELYSVSEGTTQLVPDLFARNERVITLFDTPGGSMGLILIGAIFVGSMETAWAGELRESGAAPVHWTYPPSDAPRLEKGAEMGRFNMGSTVIVLFAKDRVDWTDSLAPGHAVRLGERIGIIR